MLKIGDFARLSQVSITTLRHYDEQDLLRPVHVDPDSGYRYYSLAQLPRLNYILSLRDLGFSLEQIRRALEDGVTAAQLRGMLRLKRAEVEQRLAAERERLGRIEARLKQIEQEDTMTDHEVILKTVAPLLVASRRITIPTNNQVPQYLDPAFEEVEKHIQWHGEGGHGPCLALWYDSAATLEDEDAEAAVPLARAIPESERVKIYELPGVEVAAFVHHGPFSEFTQAHPILLAWIERNGYRITGPYREIYIDNIDRAYSTTEVQYPVEKG